MDILQHRWSVKFLFWGVVLSIGSVEASWCAPDPFEVGFPVAVGFPQETYRGKPIRVNWTASDPSQGKAVTQWERTDFFANNNIYKTIWYKDLSKTTYFYLYKENKPVGGFWKQTKLPIMELFEEKSANQFLLSLEQHDSKNTSTSPLLAAYDKEKRPSTLTSFILSISSLEKISVRYSCNYNNGGSITETEDMIINGTVIHSDIAQITLNTLGWPLKRTLFAKSPQNAEATFLEETVYTYNAQGEWTGAVSKDVSGATLGTSKVLVTTKGQTSQIQSQTVGKTHLSKFTYDAWGNWVTAIYTSEGRTTLSIQRTITY
ncbi:hypothetical protein [Deinococcus sp. QL22]|uniref:hypothetical protein n=1 Tax=Deinococcus sp. QL22 TaxID=2939437 RepID=UPI0020179B7C|nr:hypothetical protein [Deinococcus sp. QL22]UQN05144.1 hypothetical protein M1R55_09570 [Deinococcus sp. QL22]